MIKLRTVQDDEDEKVFKFLSLKHKIEQFSIYDKIALGMNSESLDVQSIISNDKDPIVRGSLSKNKKLHKTIKDNIEFKDSIGYYEQHPINKPKYENCHSMSQPNVTTCHSLVQTNDPIKPPKLKESKSFNEKLGKEYVSAATSKLLNINKDVTLPLLYRDPEWHMFVTTVGFVQSQIKSLVEHMQTQLDNSKIDVIDNLVQESIDNIVKCLNEIEFSATIISVARKV